MPLFWLSLSFLAGIALAALTRGPLPTWGWLAGGCLAAGLIAWRLRARGWSVALPTISRLGMPVWVLGLVLTAGAARYTAAAPPAGSGFIAWYNDTGQEMAVVGVVRAPPDRRDTYLNLRLQVEQVRPVGDLFHRLVAGRLLARLPPEGTWRYGDRLVLRGELATPPEDEAFSYRDYLARQGVYSFMPNGEAALLEAGQGNQLLGALFAWKERALATVYRLYPDPEASLLAGILLGVETGIPRPVQKAFQDTGTSHIIAISGFNITILAGLSMAGFQRWLGPRWGALAAALAIAVYTILVGADAAVVRAAIMGGLGIFARQVGRRQAALNSLAFSAAVMAVFNPFIPWDVGFQLSFTATLGLVLYADPLARLAEGFLARWAGPETARRLSGPASEYLLFTLAAQATTLPVTAYHFGRLSLSALLANPAILPAQPAVMVLGGLAVLLGLVWLPLGRLAAALAWPFVVYTVRVVEGFARLPSGGLVLGRVPLAAVAGFYALLLGGTWLLAGEGGRLRPWAGRLRPALLLVPLAALTVLVWRAALAAPDGRLHLTVLDVSTGGRSGEALLIQTPTGRHVLVGGGPSGSQLSGALGRRLPVGGRALDALVVANPAEYQVAALSLAWERFPPDWVLWAGPPQASRPARALAAGLAGKGIPVSAADVGQALTLGSGAQLRVLAVGRRGAVLLLEHGRFRALLPLGLDFDLLEGLLADRSLIGVSVLVLAEGGYAPLNPPAWIERLHPRLIILSVAADDREGLPSPETFQALAGYPLLRTDRNGWIEITTDGEAMWAQVEIPTR